VTQAVARPPTASVKAPTQAVAKPGTQPVRSPTQAVPRPTTQKSVTQRGKPGKTGRHTKSLVTQAKIEMHKKHLPRGLVIFGSIGLVIAICVGGWMLLPDYDKIAEKFGRETAELRNQALKLEEDHKYEEALGKYKACLSKYEALPDKVKEKLGDVQVEWKGAIKQLEDRKARSQVVIKRVNDWIAEAEKLKANFSLDSVNDFLLNLSGWILKNKEGDADKAKALYDELTKMRDAEQLKTRPWSAFLPDFSKLVEQDHQFVKAKQLADDYCANAKDPMEKANAKKSLDNLPGFAKEYLKTIRRNYREQIQKDKKKPEEVKPAFEQEIKERIGEILPKSDIDEAWGLIIKD
jgi:hypothetical protein